MFRNALLLTLTSSSLLLFSPVLAEEEKVTIAPAIIELDVSNNQKLAKEIQIMNEFDYPIPMKVEVYDYSQDYYGLPDYTADDSTWSPKGWIIPDPADFILGPLETRTVNLKISLPDEVLPGSHFATILFKPVLPPSHFEPDSSHVIPYYGAIISLNVYVEGSTPMIDFASVDEFTPEVLAKGSGVNFLSIVRNKDVYFHRVNGKVIVYNQFNNPVVEKTIDDVTLFPMNKRMLNDISTGPIGFGKYRAELILDCEGNKVAETASFWVYPTILDVILMILVVLAVAFAVLAIIKRENLKKAWAVLFKHKKTRKTVAKT